MKYTLPSPYEELSHTADAAIRACGSSWAEALARAALATSQLLSGEAPLEESVEFELKARALHQPDLPVELCRAVLERFFLDQLLLSAIEITSLELGSEGARVCARGWFAKFDPERHSEGLDIKAITYSNTGFQQEEDGSFSATLVFDI